LPPVAMRERDSFTCFSMSWRTLYVASGPSSVDSSMGSPTRSARMPAVNSF